MLTSPKPYLICWKGEPAVIVVADDDEGAARQAYDWHIHNKVEEGTVREMTWQAIPVTGSHANQVFRPEWDHLKAEEPKIGESVRVDAVWLYHLRKELVAAADRERASGERCLEAERRAKQVEEDLDKQDPNTIASLKERIVLLETEAETARQALEYATKGGAEDYEPMCIPLLIQQRDDANDRARVWENELQAAHSRMRSLIPIMEHLHDVINGESPDVDTVNYAGRWIEFLKHSYPKSEVSDVLMTHDLAQIAYHAYGMVTEFKNYQGLPMPEWADLPIKVREAWRASVDAVSMYLKRPKPNEGEDMMPTRIWSGRHESVSSDEIKTTEGEAIEPLAVAETVAVAIPLEASEDEEIVEEGMVVASTTVLSTVTDEDDRKSVYSSETPAVSQNSSLNESSSSSSSSTDPSSQVCSDSPSSSSSDTCATDSGSSSSSSDP